MSENGAVAMDADASEVERYRCGPIVRWRQGHGRELIHSQITGANKGIPADLAGALSSWRSLLTEEEAQEHIAEALPSLSRSEIAAVIRDLIRSGCLISQTQIIGSAMDTCASNTFSETAWLAIPTSNRPVALARAIRSYTENMLRFGRNCGILVSDDSHNEAPRNETLEILSSFCAATRHPIWYIGAKEKLDFAKRMAKQGDIPRDIVEFSLCGWGGAGRTTGANRNAILLHTRGSKVLSVDDDTICQTTIAPDSRVGLATAGHRDPFEMWCFPTRPAALAFGEPAVLDVVGEHTRYLGAPLQRLLWQETRTGDSSSIEEMCVHALASIAAGRAQILLTYNGARGDSGFHSDLRQVSSQSPTTRKRVQKLGNEYRASLESRSIARQVACPTITHVDVTPIGMFWGLDNTMPLPPFMPNCRNQDGIFASVLACTSDHYYAAHLPFMLAHDPPETRYYLGDTTTQLRISDVIACCLSMWRADPRENDPQRRLSTIGRHFRHLGSLSGSDFDELINVLMCSRICSTIESLEGLLREDIDAPHYWVADLTARIEALRRLTEQNAFFAPVDLPQDSDEPPQRLAQRMVDQYGQLLQWWPAIIERTIELSNREVTLGRRLN